MPNFLLSLLSNLNFFGKKNRLWVAVFFIVALVLFLICIFKKQSNTINKRQETISKLEQNVAVENAITAEKREQRAKEINELVEEVEQYEEKNATVYTTEHDDAIFNRVFIYSN